LTHPFDDRASLKAKDDALEVANPPIVDLKNQAWKAIAGLLK
jgi:hypothetical protein